MGELGKFIRKKRKEQGLRLEDLADEHISTATISNIERGVTRVNKEKIVYLLNQLKLDLHEVRQMILADSENQEYIQLKLMATETMLFLGKNNQALRFLSALPTASFTPQQVLTCTLKGKYHMNRQDWQKAEREFSKAIQLVGRDDHPQETNILADCYDQLAICRAKQADLKNALRFIEQGIDSLEPDRSDYQQMKFRLRIHQVDYLERSGRAEEALKILDGLWQEFHLLQDTRLVLQMYLLQAKLLRRVKLHQDVISNAKKGIQLAINSQYHQEMFQLWMILGVTYLDLYQLEKAETCFLFVRELKDKVQDRQVLMKAYCSLSYLYLLQNNLNKAEQAVERAIQLITTDPEPLQQEHIWILSGQIKCKQGDWQQAIEDYRRARFIAEKTERLEIALQANVELAKCHHHLQQKDQFIQTVTRIYQLQQEIHKGQLLSQWW